MSMTENEREELEQYRAIGSIERLKEIKAKSIEIAMILNKYTAIGSVEEFKALKGV